VRVTARGPVGYDPAAPLRRLGYPTGVADAYSAIFTP
jgi:hypothetical protein